MSAEIDESGNNVLMNFRLNNNKTFWDFKIVYFGRVYFVRGKKDFDDVADDDDNNNIVFKNSCIINEHF
jgi:hypothetical protein